MILFAVDAFFTQARRRRILGALVGWLLTIPLVMLYDSIAARHGWWHYPAVTEGAAPLAWYLAAALFYGPALARTA